jgi:hypothetical protein
LVFLIIMWQTMNEAQQLALAMFVLACAAVTLVSGQLYIEYSAKTASAAEPLYTTSLNISSQTATNSGAKTAPVMRGRP